MVDDRTAREARLAAALRENLKRRKAAASSLGEHAGGRAEASGLPQAAEPSGEAAKDRGTDGAAGPAGEE